MLFRSVGNIDIPSDIVINKTEDIFGPAIYEVIETSDILETPGSEIITDKIYGIIENGFDKFRETFNLSKTKTDKAKDEATSEIKEVLQKNIEKYRVYYEKIIYLYNKKDIYSNRIGLLEKLATVAPDWAEAIKTREGIHGNSVVPKDIESAWKWSQLNSQINRINSYDSNKIQREIDKINEASMVNA